MKPKTVISNITFIILVSIGVAVVLGVILLMIKRTYSRRINNENENENNHSSSMAFNQIMIQNETDNNTRSIPLSNINTMVNINNNTFIVTDRNNEKISKQEFNLIYFNNNTILQAKPNYIDKTNMYFEIEIIEYKPNSSLLIGYSNKCINEISCPSILLKGNNNGLIINKVEYANTYIHKLKSGDIVGCFYDSIIKEITFTYNGNDLNYYQFDPNSASILPTIYSMDGTLLKYNFGSFNFNYQRANLLKLGITTNYTKEQPPGYQNN